MRLFRKILFWAHLAAGLVAGVVILAMCVTGALLSFERNITEYAEREMRNVAVPANTAALPPGVLIEKLLAAKPEAKPSSLSFENDPARAAVFSLGRDGQIFIDPYTGVITGEGAKNVRSFFNVAEDVHRYIAFSGDRRFVGRAITGACNFIFLFLAISGVYIWMPRRLSIKHIRPNIWFRRGLKGKGRDFNWHNTIGFWCSIFFVAITVTALVMSYQWANNLLYKLTGNTAPQQQTPVPNPGPPVESFAIPSDLDGMFNTAKARSPEWNSIALRLPIAKDAIFTIDEGTSMNIFGRSTLTLNAADGGELKWEPYASLNSGRQLRSWFRFVHTGESGGLVGQLVGFLVCIGGVFMVYTGTSLGLRRFGHWLDRRRRRHSPKPLET